MFKGQRPEKGKKAETIQPDPAQIPVLDLIIRYDARTQQVGVMCIGGQIGPEEVYRLLEMARGWMRTQELVAMAQNGKNGEKPVSQ